MDKAALSVRINKPLQHSKTRLEALDFWNLKAESVRALLSIYKFTGPLYFIRKAGAMQADQTAAKRRTWFVALCH
jgi:hypothetical protein